MKRIELIVADEMVGPIVGLAAEYAVELHVDTVESIITVVDPIPVVKPKKARATPKRLIDGKTIETHILEWIGDRVELRADIGKFVQMVGYSEGSGSAALARMVDKGLLLRVGNKGYRKEVIDATVGNG